MTHFVLKMLPVPFFLFLVSPTPLFAANGAAEAIQQGLTATNATAGYSETKLPVLIGNVIQALLGIVGIIFLITTIYAGIMYMTAQGDTGKVDKAKKMITSSLIGLVIIIGAYAFTNFVIGELVKASSSAQPKPPAKP